MKSFTQKDINLYLKYCEDPHKADKAHARLVNILPGACVVLIMLAFITVKLNNYYQVHSEINKYNALINSPDNISLKQKTSELSEQIIDSNNEILSLESVWSELETDPKLDMNMFKTVYKCCGNDITVSEPNFSAKDNAFSFSAKAASASAIPDFIKRLKKTGIFSDVQYSGYSCENSVYSFSVSCIF